MKLKIEDYCIRCGLCEDLCPELFYFDYDRDCIVLLHDEVPQAFEEKAKQMMADCSITAIKLDK